MLHRTMIHAKSEESITNEQDKMPACIVKVCFHLIATIAAKKEFSDHCDRYGGSVVEWSACRTRNPAVPGSSPALATTWICFSVRPSSNPRPRL